MKFAIAFSNTGPFTHPAKAVEMAQAAEAAGFESLWTVEHVVVPSEYASTYPYSPTGKMPGVEDSPIPDPLIWLTYVAAATKIIWRAFTPWHRRGLARRRVRRHWCVVCRSRPPQR